MNGVHLTPVQTRRLPPSTVDITRNAPQWSRSRHCLACDQPRQSYIVLKVLKTVREFRSRLIKTAATADTHLRTVSKNHNVI